MAAERLVRHSLRKRDSTILLAAFLAASPVAAATPSTKSDVWKSFSQSWALGVVVPDGAELAGGARLSWADVNNMTAVVRLPNITEPSGVTYLILSAEGDDSAVLQVAVGVWPMGSSWLTYSWYISGLTSISPAYRWLMNSSTPSMAPGDVVSISISVERGAWGMEVHDLNTSESSKGIVPSSALTIFRSGDQEVFALESYTRSVATFEDMGVATLLSLLINGARVIGGWYAHGGWNPAHALLFEVGSSEPPAFVSLSTSRNGTATWSYDAQRSGAFGTSVTQPTALAYIALAFVVPIALVIGRRLGRASRKTRK